MIRMTAVLPQERFLQLAEYLENVNSQELETPRRGRCLGVGILIGRLICAVAFLGRIGRSIHGGERPESYGMARDIDFLALP